MQSNPQQPAKKGGSKKNVARGLLKRFGFGYFLQGVPVVGILGHFSMPTIRLVWREMKGDLAGPEGILMTTIAGLLDVASLIIALIELALANVTLGIFSSLLGWFKWLIIGIWLLVRGQTKNPNKPAATPKPATTGKQENWG